MEERKLKGCILAAGRGLRMKPFSLTTSKELIYLYGKPVLALHVDEFISNDVNEITIICNQLNVDEITKYFSDNEYKDIAIDFVVQKGFEGSADAVNSARENLEGCYILLKYGDSLTGEDTCSTIIDEFEKNERKASIITLRQVDNPEEYGIARFDNEGNLIEIVEKPLNNPPSYLANVGLSIFDGTKLFSSFDKYGIKPDIPIAEYILRSDSEVAYWIYEGERVDLGRPWNILDAAQLLINKYGGKVLSGNISESAAVSEKAYIGKNAIIGDNVSINDFCIIDAEIKPNSVISSSVIMEGSVIGNGSKIERSVIGKNCFIGQNFKTRIKSNDLSIFVDNEFRLINGIEMGLFTGDSVYIGDNLYSEAGKIIYPKKDVKTPIFKDKLIRAVFFDADNTLYQTRKISKKADLEALKYFEDITEKEADELYYAWLSIVDDLKDDQTLEKRSRRYSYTKLLEREEAPFSYLLIEKAYQKFLCYMKEHIELYDGVIPLLEALSEDYLLAIYTSDSVEQFLIKYEKLGLEKYIKDAVTSDDVGMLKPSEKYFNILLKRLNLSYHETIFIGDNVINDLHHPYNQGGTTIWFKPDEKDTVTKEDISSYSTTYVAEDYLKIKKLISSL